MGDGPAIRQLTKEEREAYTSAVVQATRFVRSFRDALALLRPYADESASTAYTDPFARVGLGPWFFTLNLNQRASVLLHETMHVLNNHFVRGESLGAHPEIMNYAGDFEINCGLDKLPDVDLHYGVFPDKAPFAYKRFLSMEQYCHLLKEDMKDKFTDPACPQHGKNAEQQESSSSSEKQESTSSESGQASESESGQEGQREGQASSASSSSSSDQESSASESSTSSQASSGAKSESQASEGNGEGEKPKGSMQGKAPCTCPKHPPKPKGKATCDEATDERSAAADEAGIARASESEQAVAKKNTLVRMVEELNETKGIGDGHMEDFLTFAQKHMQPPKVSWQSIFRRVISKLNDSIIRGRADYSYRRVNRRSHDSEYIFPGMVQYIPQVIMGVDTSGSMDTTDFMKALSEAEGILKAAGKAKDSLTIFSVDTKVSKIAPVKSLSQVKLTGGGGTDMSVAFAYVNELPAKKKPDIFVLATDGHVPWTPVITQVLKGMRDYRSVVLITTKSGYNTVPRELKRLVTVIDCSTDH